MTKSYLKSNIHTLKDLFKISSLPVIFASLCCFSPIILFLLGLSTASFASSLATDLYENYAWHFRGLGVVFLAIALIYYLRKAKGVCTLDDAKRRRNEIMNIALITLIVSVLGYLLFTYVILHYVGVYFDLWV